MVKSVVGVFIQNRDIDVCSVQGVKLQFQFVIARQKLLAKCREDVLQLGHQLADVDKLSPLLRQLQRLELAVDALGHRAFLVEVVLAVNRSLPGRYFPQSGAVSKADFVKRLFPPIDLQLGKHFGNRLFADAEMVTNLFKCQWLHTVSTPLGRW